jgi:aspartate aminotransferase
LFNHLNAIPADPILGLINAFNQDPNPKKIDLGVGVYRDEEGNTPMLGCVVDAEKRLIDTQTTKTYLGPPGVAGFNDAITDVIFGADSLAVQQGRVRTIQTPGGTAALRVAGDLLKVAKPEAQIWASDPTWANHIPVFEAADVPMNSYPYFDAKNSVLLFDEMIAALQQRSAGDVVLFHACCHNPCGVSPSPEQWHIIADLAAERGFTPMIDIAYMGFERGIEEDTLAVRLFTERCPEVIVASSCSKNFAMYRDRVGALSIVAKTAQKAADIVSVIHNITRPNYSMPPAHGPHVIDIILHSDELTKRWVEEVAVMRNRINAIRKKLAESLAASGIQRDFSFLQRQTGMFSFLGISVDQVRKLRSDYAIYIVDSSRINLASFNNNNMDYFVNALVTVLDE